MQHIENAIWVPSKNSFALMISRGDTYFSFVDISSESIVEVINRDYENFAWNNDIQFSHNSEFLASVQGSQLLSWDLLNNGYWKIEDYQDDWKGYGDNGKISFSLDDKILVIRDSQTITHFYNTEDYSIAQDPMNGRHLYLQNDYFATSDGIYLGKPPTQVNSIGIKNNNYDFNETSNLLAIIDNGLSVMKFSDDYSSFETIFTDQSSYDWWVVSKLSPDGKYVAAERKSGLSVWNLQSGELTCELDKGWGWSNYVFSPDSQMIAVGKYTTASSMISIYDLEECNEQFSTGGYFDESNYAPRIAFSPDGKYFAILTKYGYPQIWGIP